MADRSHLSIGEVLSLLQDDFPDVTISKIRFLESQGLLDPERTPSGYRKFYEGDIERLRWILRHQRDHFLPLKVIKERLEESAAAGLVVPPDEPLPAVAPDDVPADAEPVEAAEARQSPPRRPSLFAGRAQREPDAHGDPHDPGAARASQRPVATTTNPGPHGSSAAVPPAEPAPVASPPRSRAAPVMPPLPPRPTVGKSCSVRTPQPNRLGRSAFGESGAPPLPT